MGHVGQVVAAVAGGALLVVAVVGGIRLYDLWRWLEVERRKRKVLEAERERRIVCATRRVMAGVESARAGAVAIAPGSGAELEGSEPTVEVRTKAHLRMLTWKQCKARNTAPPTFRSEPGG